MVGFFKDDVKYNQFQPDPTTWATTPPGLRNIGNTCYLNSLLQYFYNVKPVRDLVLQYPHHKLQLDEETVNARRTGGNGTTVDLGEAIVGRLCRSLGIITLPALTDQP
jgi:ubiquitin carboxyl-terminal hydrolase 25/28